MSSIRKMFIRLTPPPLLQPIPPPEIAARAVSTESEICGAVVLPGAGSIPAKCDECRGKSPEAEPHYCIGTVFY